jgi:hypothetical protein
MKLTIYISGPMTGKPGLNFDAFNAAAAKYRAQGHTVINPAELNPDPSTPWVECMKVDIAALLKCNAIKMLPGWCDSRGARLERYIAWALNFKEIVD